MQRPAFPEYKNYRYLRLTGLLAAVALLAYWLSRPAGGMAYGGSGFGYVSGILSAGLILLLAAYGLRKRHVPKVAERRKGDRRRQVIASTDDMAARRSTDRRKLRAEDHWRFGGSLQGWLAAHVYLGLLLVLLASLHTGFRFALNVHSLAYFLLLGVVASGVYGVFAYLRYPRLIADNLGDDTLDDIRARLAELDELARVRALALPDEVNLLVAQAGQDNRQNCGLGGGLFHQLRSAPADCPTDRAVRGIEALGKVLIEGDQPRHLRDLYALLLQKQRLLVCARTDIRLNARLQFWLYLHVPLTLGLLAALLAHVAVILIFW